MHPATIALEGAVRATLLLYLLWIPLPFGSVTPFSQLPLVLPPLVFLVVAAMISAPVERKPTPAWRIWNSAGLLFIGIAAVQLLPLGSTLVGLLSARSAAIWDRARAVVSLMGSSPPIARLTIAPSETWTQLLRAVAYLALFRLGYRLFKQRSYRLALTAVLAVSAAIQAGFAIRQWSDANSFGIHRVWDWPDAEIFNRSSGTFVNPNHFAIYLALIAPLLVYAAASIWRWSAGTQGAFVDRLARLLERGFIRFGLMVLALLLLGGGLLLSQSRAAVGILALSLTVLLPALPRPRREKKKGVSALLRTAAAALVVGAGLFFLSYHLGNQATSRLRSESLSLAGRTTGLRTALEVWRRFPLTGSGLGTFPHAVWMTHSFLAGRVFNHVHNDYLELLATAGIAGLAVIALQVDGFVLLIAAWLKIGKDPMDRRERRFADDDRLYVIAGAASIAIVATHLLVDFDFYIPAIPATLAVIAGSVTGASALSFSWRERNEERDGAEARRG